MTQLNSISGLSETTIESIRSHIQTELTKRGFHAPVKLEGHTHHRAGYMLKLTSEPFQTAPVIFKEIRIGDFGSWVKQDEEHTQRLLVSIRVNAAYEHFTGGSNGCELFTLRCVVRTDTDGFYEAYCI